METKETTEPHIKIFNEEIGSSNKNGESIKKDKVESCRRHHHDHEHRGSGVFGLIILFIGIFALLDNLGFVSGRIWAYILPFWPVILILIGLKIILGRSVIARSLTFFVALILLSYIFMNAWVNTRGELPYYMRLSPEMLNFNNK